MQTKYWPPSTSKPRTTHNILNWSWSAATYHQWNIDNNDTLHGFTCTKCFILTDSNIILERDINWKKYIYIIYNIILETLPGSLRQVTGMYPISGLSVVVLTMTIVLSRLNLSSTSNCWPSLTVSWPEPDSATLSLVTNVNSEL